MKHEYLFEVKLFATIRVEAKDREIRRLYLIQGEPAE